MNNLTPEQSALLNALDSYVAYSIECTSCGEDTERVAEIGTEAAQAFHAAGWRVRDDDVLCPDCVREDDERK